jgi:hypothetical protein
LLHRVSSDNGLTWARPKGLASFAEETSRPALTSDLAGRLHLLQAEQNFSGNLVLSHWLWDRVRWGATEALDLVGQSEHTIEQLAADISDDGELAAAFSSAAPPSIDNQSLTQLNFTSRGIDIPEASVGTIVQPETALEVTPTAGPTSTPEPASTPEVPKEPDANLSLGPIPLTNSWMGVVLGGGIAVFLVVLGFGVLLLIRRSR